MKIVKIVKWLEVPAPEGDPPGWYYYYDLGEAVLTEEHGPFPTREAALADAKAGMPAGWATA